MSSHLHPTKPRLPSGLFTLFIGLCFATAELPPGVAREPIVGELTRGFLDQDDNGYFWLRHIGGRGVGDVWPYTNFGMAQYLWRDNGLLMITADQGPTNNGDLFANLGVIRRLFLTDDTIIGAGFWYDVNQSRHHNVYHQGAYSLELLRDDWSLRTNGYLPIGPTVQNVFDMGTGVGAGNVGFQGHNLITGGVTNRLDESPMKGIDVEIARSIGNWSGEVFVGYYNFQGKIGRHADGIKGGVRGYVTPHLAANVTVGDDPVFGTNVFGGFTWFFGGSGGRAPATVADKLTIPVERNQQIVVNEVQTQNITGTVILTSQNVPITVMHVNDSGVAGDGTFENPHGSLSDANTDANKANRDIAYVHSGTTFNNQSYAAAPNQRVLGEGSGNTHTVDTDQLGPINLPQAAGLGNPRPVIQNVAGTAFDASNGSEISNFNIFNANTAFRLNNLTSNVNVNRALITGGTTGIDILGGTGTFTFTNVAVIDPTTVGIHVNGGSSTIDFGAPNDPTNGLFGPSALTQSSGGTAVLVEGGHNGELNQDPSSPIGATNGNGLQFDNAHGDYNFSGPVTLNGGDAGIDILGGSAGTFTFTNTTITSPTGTAVNVDGGTADVTFELGSSVAQANNASAVNVQGGHTGMLDFAGSINATGGDGLQFDSANGTYDFGGPVTLNGGDAGIGR